MFVVTHELTHYQWQVATKDELLMELDVLIVKNRTRGMKETVFIEQLASDGQQLDRLALELPIEESIDDVLSDFGVVVVNEPRQSRFGFLNRFKKLANPLKRGKKHLEREQEKCINYKTIPPQPVEERDTEERKKDTPIPYITSSHEVIDTALPALKLAEIQKQLLEDIQKLDKQMVALEGQKQHYQNVLQSLEQME